MKVEVHYIAEDCYACARCTERGLSHAHVVSAGLLAAIPGSLVALALGRLGCAAAGLGVAAAVGMISSLWQRKHLAAQWHALPPATFTATDDTLEWSSTNGKARFLWTCISYLEVVQDRLMMRAGMDVIMIPKRSFASAGDFEVFVEKARSGVRRAAQSDECSDRNELLPGPLGDRCKCEVLLPATREDHQALWNRAGWPPLIKDYSRQGTLLGVGSWLQMLAVPVLDWAFFAAGQFLSAWACWDIGTQVIIRLAAFDRPHPFSLLPLRMQLSHESVGFSTCNFVLELPWAEFVIADHDERYIYLFQTGAEVQGIAVPRTAFPDPGDFERFWKFIDECMKASRPNRTDSSPDSASPAGERGSPAPVETANPYQSPRSEEADLSQVSRPS